MTHDLRAALAARTLVADGAMGTMLQAYNLGLDDFGGLEGCNEMLNLTRPDVVSAIHQAYFAAGADCVETNTFGANLTALGEYDIADQVFDLAKAGAGLARAAADAASTPQRPRFVLGSMGPGTKLPSLRHVSYRALATAYQQQSEGMLAGGIDGFLVETSQDLLQAKAAINGARAALRAYGADLPIFVDVTIETSGTMLLGTEIGAAMAALGRLGVEGIGLNCGTGPVEMSEHLRQLSRQSDVTVVCMPNAGLPEITADGARYPMGPVDFVGYVDNYAREFGIGLVGGCCGTTPEHIAKLAEAVQGKAAPHRDVTEVPAVSSLYAEVPLHQDTSYLSIGERTNANGSKAFREAMLAQDWDECVDIAKQQSRGGAHVLDLCVDYVGRDGAADMAELASRLGSAVPLPIVLDSTEPAVLQTGLELLGGRCVVNSVNFEDGDGPDSRFTSVMKLVVEHGAAVVALTIDEEGQARTTEWKLRVADRLVTNLTEQWGLRTSDIIVDCLTFPIATGQEETRRDAIHTIDAIRQVTQKYPGIHTTLGISNVSFGLNPAARQVLNSVFLHECVQAGLDSAIVPAARILPIARIPEEQRRVAEDLIYDRRSEDYDPLSRFLELFEGVSTTATKEARAAEMAALPVPERLRRRIIDGDPKGLEADLDAALKLKPALDIINEDLLGGMKTVGELFGSGQMQLPFVLSSAEVMKTCVRYLEPHLDRADVGGKGTLVLATVKGDVHDIGKNLVDIILTNNGYTVVNLGIKQPVSAIIEAALVHSADAIGMSGLLVKSTQVMRDNLEELTRRGLTDIPVLLGGAALTRSFVEEDLNDRFPGEVRYAKDAFEGLSLMESVVAVKSGLPGASLPEPRRRQVRATVTKPAPHVDSLERSEVARGVEVPTPPFWGSRVVKGIALDEVSGWLDERATFRGQWGLKPISGGASYEEIVETEARPRLRAWLDRLRTERIVEPAVVYGYWPCHAEGNTLILGDPSEPGTEVARFTWPRQSKGRRLCLADFFRDAEEAASAGPDVIGLQLVTMGPASEATAKLFAADAYRDYLELHGLTVQLAEALAEMWHARVRAELGLTGDGAMNDMIHHQAYQGSRFSFGYAACPELADRATLVSLLGADRIGVTLSEEFQLHPEQSTDAIIVHHPEAKYFNAR
ncbi:MAG TPA: methionine synthase [Propionicimonas sp.]|nr:methionine synthase [Propionicimonas sp.]